MLNKNSIIPSFKNFCTICMLIFITGIIVLVFSGCAQDSDKKTSDKKPGSDSVTTKKDSIDNKIGIEIVSKEFKPGNDKDTKDYNVVVYKLTNNTAKEIKEIEADVLINDASGSEVKKVKITFVDKLPSKASANYTALYNCNQFADPDMRLKTAEMKDLRFETSVLNIVYNDGTKDVRK